MVDEIAGLWGRGTYETLEYEERVNDLTEMAEWQQQRTNCTGLLDN